MGTREVYRKKALECLLAADGMANLEHFTWPRLGMRENVHAL